MQKIKNSEVSILFNLYNLIVSSNYHVHYFSLANDSFTTAASTLSIGDFCKICHCGSEINQPLIAPCFCSGSLKFVHQECLQKWIKSSDIKRCELCKYPFDMQAKVSYKLRIFIKHCIACIFNFFVLYLYF